MLVRCYHGLGDTLQFCRYLAPLRRRVRRLTLEVQPELIPLLAAVPGPDRIVAVRPGAPGAAGRGCDLEIMELAHALRLPPDPAPYLPVAAPPRRRSAGCASGCAGRCRRIGARSAPSRLRRWRRSSAVPGVALLQPAARRRRRCPGAPRTRMRRPAGAGARRRALIAGLDLVVTVDTMVAHLAGAIGVPVWLLLIAEPDWRWLAGGRGSPWYRGRPQIPPATEPGDWAAPVAALTLDLTRAARDHSVAGTRDSSPGL